MGAVTILQGVIVTAEWGNRMVVAGIAMSMTVNALATGLIVLRIFKVLREVKAATTSDEQLLGATGGSKLQTIIFIVIESGMALFSIQLIRLVVTVLATNAATANAFQIIISIHQMLNVIIRSSYFRFLFY